jgi:hypothetical protein
MNKERLPGGMVWRILGAGAVLAGIILAAHAMQEWRDAGWRSLDAWEWFWLTLLPVWLYIFFRYYSIFRQDCHACLDLSPRRDPPAP